MKSFIKYTIIWISQNLAIPFWVVGHVHLSIHSFKDAYETLASLAMNIIVLIGFIIDYNNERTKAKQDRSA
jgi:hypothetical protein